MLDVVVPFYNPNAGWAFSLGENVKKLQILLPEITIHLILVNDGSSFGVTPNDIQYLRTHISKLTYLSYVKNKGKGYALREGIRHSRSPICIFTDIDFPYTETSFANVYKALKEERADIIIGIRNSDYYNQVPPNRMRVSKFLKGLTKNILRLPIQDTQCGLKGFNRSGLIVLSKTKINRYLFDLEFIYLASKLTNELTMLPIEVELKSKIVFSEINPKILIQESYSFLKLYFKSLVPYKW